MVNAAELMVELTGTFGSTIPSIHAFCLKGGGEEREGEGLCEGRGGEGLGVWGVAHLRRAPLVQGGKNKTMTIKTRSALTPLLILHPTYSVCEVRYAETSEP